MLVGEAAGIGALARRLDLDEADKCVADGDGVVGPCAKLGERAFADQRDRAFGQAREAGEIAEQASSGPRNWSSGALLAALFDSLAFVSAPNAPLAAFRSRGAAIGGENQPEAVSWPWRPA